MPIEIRELVIKAAISEETESGGGGSNRAGEEQASTDAIVRACVEKVLEIIKEKSER